MRNSVLRWARNCSMAVSLLLLMMGTASPAAAEEKLVVWWNKGYYKAEEDALLAVIKKFEAKTGVKVELSQYATQDMMPKLVAALDAGSPPDVTYADTYHFQGAGKWASEGKLVDLGSVLAPIKGEFSPQSLETVMLYNDKTKAKAYYAFPLKQATLHLHYWKDMLEEGGLKETDIPKDWKGYWSFWCDKAQPAAPWVGQNPPGMVT
ncbi:ABC-type glycerol-3-phosphate transport system substrate-binding protein [Bradyrhizobium japonicum]